MKILASRPDGTVALATVRSELSLLMSAGRWAGGDNPVARRDAPSPDLFSSGFVIRVGEAWQISASGRAYLEAYGDGRFSSAVLQDVEPVAEAAQQPVQDQDVISDLADDPARTPKSLVVIDGAPAADPVAARLPPGRGTSRRLRTATRRLAAEITKPTLKLDRN